MPTPQELEAQFWKALKSDMTMMLGLDGVQDGHARPMTAQVEDDRGPIPFFTTRDNALAKTWRGAIAPSPPSRPTAMICLRRSMAASSLDNDRAVIDRLWNRYVAAWYERGKDDPKLALVRLDAERAELADASSLVAGIKMLFGANPKQDYKDKVAEVRLK